MSKLNDITRAMTYIDPQQHPLFKKLFTNGEFEWLTESNLTEFLTKDGLKLAIFADDPNERKVTLDMVVIAPELKKAFAGNLSCSVWADFTVARSLAARWGMRSFPSVAIFLNDQFWGAVQGLKTWDEYCQEITKILLKESPAPRTIALFEPQSKHDQCEE